MQINLSAAECNLLLEVLQSYRSDLFSEIHRTDSAAYKNELKEEETLLDGIIGKLRNPSRSEAEVQPLR